VAVKVLTLGTFDLMHPGHVGLFLRCRHIAGDHGTGTVTVAVNESAFVARFKREPVQTLSERMLLVQACRHVDDVIPNTGDDQPGLISRVNPDVIVIGSDWARKDYLTQLGIDQDFLDTNDIALCYVPRTGDWSTTELKDRRVDRATG